MRDLPRVLVTGASGFLGRRLAGALRHRARVIGIDRNPRPDAYVGDHPYLEWYQIDLAEKRSVRDTFEEIRGGGRVDAVVHLAAYYDFTGEPHPEYQRTNIDATKLLLEVCRPLGLRRFIYASSVAACGVTKTRIPITEDSPPDGHHIYATTKRCGEEMMRAHLDAFPCTPVRFGAMYSDWCEYPPLYKFIETWLSARWDASILGGRGESSIPFLHVRDGVSFLLRLIERMDDLDRWEVVVASCDGSISHRQLFDTATAYEFGRARKPISMPKWLALPGITVRDLLGRFVGERPFERPWMAEYIDTHLFVDASRTRRRLGWEPHPRLEILNRIPFMVENRRTATAEWTRRNVEAIEHHMARPHYEVYRLLQRHESRIVEDYLRAFEDDGDPGFRDYRRLPAEDRARQARQLVRELMESTRTGLKGRFMAHCRQRAELRCEQGFSKAEVLYALQVLQRQLLEIHRTDPEAARLDRAIHEYVTMTLEFGVDQVYEVFEEYELGGPPARPGSQGSSTEA